MPATSAASAAALNPIQIENSQPGTTGWELQIPAYSGQIEGYPSRESLYPGQTISFHVSTKAVSYKLQIFRIGWYGGTGGRLLYTMAHIEGHRYPTPKPQSSTGLIVCNWPASLTLKIPADWVSGFYLVKLSAYDSAQSYIPFLLKQAGPARSPLIMLDETGTSEAYNWWGGTSLFTNTNYKKSSEAFAHRAVKVSFLRPFAENFGAGWFLSWEIHTVRWLEKNGYDVSYASELDANNDPNILLNRKGIIIAGHDEYWTAGIRNSMQNAVAHGVNYANLAANTGYWQSRLEAYGSDKDAIEVCYKDFQRDPEHKIDPKLTTVTWRSPQVGRPESELTGAMYGSFEGDNVDYAWVPTDVSNWVFAGTGMHNGQKVTGLVGQEDDNIVNGYPHPRHIQILSRSPIKNSVGWKRAGTSTVYQAVSGAWVFDAASIDWGWGLDDFQYPNDGWFYNPDRGAPSPYIEKITANVLNRFLLSKGG